MGSSSATGIRVKGIREGILLGLDDHTSPYKAMLQQLRLELSEKQAFLEGSRIVLDVGRRVLKRAQLSEIQELMAESGLELWAVLAEPELTKDAARQLGLATRLAGSNTDLDGNLLVSEALPGDTSAELNLDAGPGALLLRETIRSGQSIYHEGHVIIIGDVNPGAEIIAGGNVIVWGRLRGLVHAGALGDQTAVICALHLAPTQLRIGDQIAIPPDERDRIPVPEMAAIHEGIIVAEVWRTRD